MPELDHRPRFRSRAGALAVLAQGLAHAALSLWLAVDGQRPSRPPPLGFEDPYAVQALYVAPLYLAAWALASVAAARVQGRMFSSTAGGIGLAIALPYLALTLVPDAIVYATGGFDALGALFRVTAPATALATLVALAFALRGPRRVLAVVVVLVVQALVVTPFVR